MKLSTIIDGHVVLEAEPVVAKAIWVFFKYVLGMTHAMSGFILRTSEMSFYQGLTDISKPNLSKTKFKNFVKFHSNF